MSSVEVIERFDSGARKVRISDGVEVGISRSGLIYWASDGGWGWVLDQVRNHGPHIVPETTRQELAFGVSGHHADYRWTGPA